MNTRFYNARICTMEEDMRIFEGELWVEGNRIAYAGPAKPSGLAFGREIDAGGNLILPGFKNAHTHSAMTFLRSLADDLPLLDWLEKQVFPREARLLPEHIVPLSQLALMEYLTSGITANFDMYFHAEEIARASVEFGFRTVLCGSVNNFYSRPEQMEEEYRRFNEYHELISCRLGFHAEYTCAPELLEKLAGLVAKLKAPVFCHSSESRREVEECLGRTGKTPTAYMDGFGLFSHGGGCFHCVHMRDEDLDLFGKRGLAVITNPASNSKLASGIAPLCRMAESGIPIAIGTDGPASNNALDMFREMYLATVLQKLDRGDASAMDADRVLYMACSEGARVMGLSDCDSLAAGKLADLILIDLKQPNMQPLNNLTKNLVYSGGRQNVKLTMVNGKILYENGRFYTGIEPDDLYGKVQAIADELRGS